MKKQSKVNDLWEIKDKNKFIITMWDMISEKCQDGDAIDVLSEQERIFFVTQVLEMEVNNGGFSQFFYNSSGNFSNELIQSFTEIGASKTAEICKKALSIFGEEVPTDRYERQDLLDQMEEEEAEEIFDECDEAFYEYAEDLTTLNYEYVIKNKKYFTCGIK